MSGSGKGRAGRRLAALALVSALALVLAAVGRAQQAPETLRYRVEVTTPGSAGPAVWHVYHGPDGAALVPPAQPPHPLNAWAIVENGARARPLVVRAAREELVPAWSAESEYSPGVTVEGKSAALVLRDLNWDMIRGGSDRTVAGRPTRHYVVTATMKVLARPGPTFENLGQDSTLVTSRTDLWIDPSRPFSWAPIALWGSRALSLENPVADAHLRRQLGPELAGLGFPLRMQVRLTYREYGDADFTFGNDARTQVVVTDLQPAEPPAVPARFLQYSRTSVSQ